MQCNWTLRCIGHLTIVGKLGKISCSYYYGDNCQNVVVNVTIFRLRYRYMKSHIQNTAREFWTGRTATEHGQFRTAWFQYTWSNNTISVCLLQTYDISSSFGSHGFTSRLRIFATKTIAINLQSVSRPPVSWVALYSVFPDSGLHSSNVSKCS